MKREKFLWPLTQTHHRGLVLAKRIREEISKIEPEEEKSRLQKNSQDILRVYEGELRQHFRDEEEMLSLFEKYLGGHQPEAERVRQEHRLMESMMPPFSRESQMLFAETLTAHIRFEEDVFFGRLEKTFSELEKEKWTETLVDHVPQCY